MQLHGVSLSLIVNPSEVLSNLKKLTFSSRFFGPGRPFFDWEWVGLDDKPFYNRFVIFDGRG
jgi:hypothetical protein